MNIFRKCLFVLMILASVCGYSQNIGIIERSVENPPRTIKPENGLIISWMSGIVNDSTVDQVEIFDERGHKTIGLNVLRPVQEAKDVSIYDITARPDSRIAVAAVYTSIGNDAHLHITNSLLLFDFSGHLSRVFSLKPPLGVRKLSIDEKGNIWTLTDNDGDKDPATVPLIVEYSPEAKIKKEVLTRAEFPTHAGILKENLETGRISMGYDSGVLSVWLPGSTDYITVSTGDSKATVTKTQMPKRANYTEVPLSRFIRETSGDLVAEFREDGPNDAIDLAYFRWSASKRSWSQFKPGGCEGERLEGFSGGRQIYLNYRDERTDICAAPVQ